MSTVFECKLLISTHKVTLTDLNALASETTAGDDCHNLSQKSGHESVKADAFCSGCHHFCCQLVDILASHHSEPCSECHGAAKGDDISCILMTVTIKAMML